MRIRTLALALIVVTMGCRDTRQPTGPAAPSDPSKIISDGAHGGNKDFFFLPPMVPLPINNADFELGQFNNTLGPSIRIDICELKSENLNARGLPTESTGCVSGAPIKTFPAGSVNVVNLPLRQNGWWSALNLPPDGFYYALWDTRQSALNVNKYYRIKVFIDGAADPLGVADVDPMANIFQWKYTNTGQVIQLVDDSKLPITFRIEKGGGSALCGTSNLCVSKTITNSAPSGSQTVTLDGGAGSIAGAEFLNGWLPAGGPQTVVVTIAEIATAGGGSTTDPSACHAGLPLPQYRGCFSFTTTPALQPINENGDEFALPVRVAVCYELDGSGNPLEKFAELWSSGPDEPPHPLDNASDGGLLGAASRNCNKTPIIGRNSSSSVSQLASAGWQRLKTGLGDVFGVKTAYAVDLGLGGFTLEFSRISPVLSASIVAYTPTLLTNMPAGATTTATARIVGSNQHGNREVVTGFGGLPVTFTLTEGNGTLRPLGSEGEGSNQVVVTTNTNPIDGGPVSGGGFAPVNWTLPTTPGTYTLSATADRTVGGPVTFTAIVPAPIIGLNTIQGTWQNEDPNTTNIALVNLSVEGTAVAVQAFGSCGPSYCDWGWVTGDASTFSTNQQIAAFWDQGFATQTMTIKALSATRLQITTFTDFTPADGRTDYTMVEYFRPPT